MASNLPSYNISSDAELSRLTEHVREAYSQASMSLGSDSVDPDSDDAEPLHVQDQDIQIAPFPELIGIDPAVYRQIEAALKAGKRHLMFYGPPGTGKTEIARALAGILNPKWRLITGSADWTSQDIIGGYQPIGGGEIGFIPGVLLRDFDRPLIIDELNRCDIDKVIGPLFTVLSGQASALPYRLDVADKDSEHYVILPQPKPGAANHEFAPSNAWRIIATINSIDKASLYQMSYALTRRFAWIYVDAPSDLTAFLIEYLTRRDLLKSTEAVGVPPIVTIWTAVNAVRAVGAAPVIDMIRAVSAIEPAVDFMLPATESSTVAYLDGFYMFLLPMLDGILRHEAEQIAASFTEALKLEPSSPEAIALSTRLLGMAIG